MKYNSSNKPLVCMQTQSTCYKGTSKMTVKGVLWHSTGANNKTLKRYVQPSDTKPEADTYDKAKWLEVLGTNSNKNDWNHVSKQAGLNGWIGILANGTVAAVQTMPWDYKPWGCGSGSKGSCNNGWIQFEICEDGLTDKEYFNKVYTEACELTAYLCQLYSIDPTGTVTVNGVKVPTILCHADSYKLGFGSNHGDVNHWFPNHGKNMKTVRDDVAKLLKEAQQSVLPTIDTSKKAKTYEVITDLITYSTASDAKTRTNAKGTYTQGTYYIYTKYPDGVDGMLNISKDTNGTTAGSWINPADNVVAIKEETVQKLYRVRISWSDAKSQKGAFSSLDNAKDCCQKAGDGYKVFDWEGNEVYAHAVTEMPKAPEVPEQPITDKKEEASPDTIVPVYDQEYPQKHVIVDSKVPSSFNKETCTKAILAIKNNNKDFDAEIAKVFFALAPKYKIDPARAIAQSVLETGWFKFANSSVKSSQHNYCGLGATGGAASGAVFDTIENGVRAQLQHLFAYGCKENLPTGESVVDPRFNYVTRGIATYWEQLAGRWAVPGYDGDSVEAAIKAGATYGQKIDKLYNTIVTTIATESDVLTYFTEDLQQDRQEEPIVNPDTPAPDQEVLPVNPDIDEGDKQATDKIKFIIDLLEKIITILVKFFSKKP